ncbi:MAG: DNA/RNA nuclease SfsA [Pseudomonadota bacterium]
MFFQTPLEPGTLIRRYKRFLADIRLDDGREITAHCANPGAMLGLTEPGRRVWVEPVADPRRKLRFTWRLLDLGEGRMVGVDTGLPNRLVGDALRARELTEFSMYDEVLPEQRYGENSRIDFLLRSRGQADAYIEVKSVTLSRQQGLAEFPDSVTSRGARHLRDLAAMARQGFRATLLYVVQRSDCSVLKVARDLDPVYATAMDEAIAAGVEIASRDVSLAPDCVCLRKKVPFEQS